MIGPGKLKCSVVLSVLALLPIVQARATDKDLVLHYPFDGSVTPAVGKELGMPKVTGSPKFVAGRHGQAISLTDGVHLLLNLPEVVAKGEVTVSLWMKPLWHPKDNLPHPIFEIPAKPKSYDKVLWSTGQWFFSKGWSESISPNGVQGVNDSGMALLHMKPGQWTHVTLTYSLKGLFRGSYFNGEGGRRPFKPDYKLHFHENRMWLGSRVGGRGEADVLVDDLRIYKRAVGPADISAIAGVTFPKPRDYALLGNEVDPARAVETPHRVLAKPYAGGRARVVFVCEGKRAREIFELAQRVDIEPVPVTGPTLHRNTLVNPETFAAMSRQVDAALAKGDVDAVVLCSYGWNLLSESTRKAVMAFVRAGGGLLLAPPRCIKPGPGGGISRNLAHYWTGWAGTPEGGPIEKLVGRLDRPDEDYLTAGVPWRELGQFKVMIDRQPASTLFRGGQVGKGRILLYEVHSCASSHTALTPGIAYVRPFDPFEYEYALGVAAKAVLWAAGREGRVHVRDVRWTSQWFFRKAPIGLRGRWTVTIENRECKPVRVRIELAARNRQPGKPFTAARNLTVKPGLTRIHLPYTPDRFGTVFADVRLVRDKKVADWAAGTITVTRGNLRLVTMEADRPVYEDGQQPRITAEVLYRDYGMKPVEPGVLRWRLFDAYDRLVARAERQVVFEQSDQLTAPVTWTLPALANYSLQYKLIVDAYGPKGKKQGDSRTLVLRCRQRDADDVVFYTWHGGHTVTSSLAARFMRDRHGLTCLSTQVTGRPVDERFLDSLDWTATLNLRPWVHATALGGTVDKQYRRKPNLADVATWQKVREKLKRVAKASEPYSPLFYSLGDETKLGPTDAEPSPGEDKLFRAYLKKRYGDLAKLNAAWKTDYKAWDAIAMPTTQDLRTPKGPAGLRHEVAPFRNTLFADTIDGHVRAIRSVAPDAKVGIEGIFGLQHAWGAFDYSKVVPRATLMGQYALGRELDMVRSFQKPGDLLSCWYNYTFLDKGYCLSGPWHTLLRGLTAFGWYTSYEGSKYTALNPDFTTFDHFTWTWEELAPIMAGIGKLVVGLERDGPGVYLLYEHRNLHRTSPHYHAMLVMTALLEDLGIHCNWISSQQVAAGALKGGKVKALVLAGQYVMRRDVVKAIQDYVTAGGTVISDRYPGVSDGLEPYKPLALNAIFASAKQLQGGLPPKTEADLAKWATHEKAVGKGRTLVFGAYAPSHLRERFKPTGALLRNVVGRFLRSRGVWPAFSIRTADGALRPTTVVCYRDGASRYVGLQRDYKLADQAPHAFELVGPAKAHIYDVRAGKYLGHADRCKLTLEVARGALVAFLLYRAKQLDIQGLPKTAKQGDRLELNISLKVDGAKPDGGVLRIDVRDPAGKKAAALSSKVRSKGGQAQIVLPIAYNDPVGKWTVEATDIATGVSAKTGLQVQAAKQ
jgi:concanavalin A-like lectin/glucanase superfamily protein/glycosyl hydrolase family 42 (putative beta-galactosidase)